MSTFGIGPERAKHYLMLAMLSKKKLTSIHIQIANRTSKNT
jgi:hypothetical protein